MPGINLAQSAGENSQGGISMPERQRKASRGGVYLMFGLGFLILVGWGAIHYALLRAEADVEAIVAEVAQKKENLSGGAVDRVADIKNRLDIIDEVSVSLSTPFDILSALEKTVHPNVVFTNYEYNEEERTISIEGKSDTYRAFVEQLVAFRSIPDFERASIEKADRADSGVVEFGVGIKLTSRQKQTPNV